MVHLTTLLDYCQERLKADRIVDFPGAHNGLQVERDGPINHLGAAVDASTPTLEKAIAAGVDLLIVHHGLFWTPLTSLRGSQYQKFKLLLKHNLALLSYHLPLDAHPELGNNTCIAKALGLEGHEWSFSYQKTPLVPTFKTHGYTQKTLKSSLEALFAKTITPIEYGPESLGTIAICSGSGSLAVQEMSALGVSTLITGELRQSCFSIAQEEGLNLYACGHYATETFGVKALGEELAQRYSLEFSFVDNPCPL